MSLTQPSSRQDPFAVLLIAEPGNVSDQLSRALHGEPDLAVSGPHSSGVEGVSNLRRQHFDVIIIDIGMRRENALISLGRILKIDSRAKILMASTLSFENVRKSISGFEQGAADFIQTPADFTKLKSQTEFRKEFLRTVRSLAIARRDAGRREVATASPQPKAPPALPPLRPFRTLKPKLIAVASSTGGPQALHNLFGKLARECDVPILITQHMPKAFTSVLAANLANRTNRQVVEAKHGDPVEAGRIYIAPGDYHMEVHAASGQKTLRLNQDPPINFCRPSADPMLSSVAAAYGSEVLTVILTGMGSDGKNGAKAVLDAGGQIIAQDFESSVVWGMPGAVAMAGYCSKVLPLDEIAPCINRLFR